MPRETRMLQGLHSYGVERGIAVHFCPHAKIILYLRDEIRTDEERMLLLFDQ